MVILAIATPGLALLIFCLHKAGMMSLPPRSRMVILLLAGPVNLLLWLMMNRYFDAVRHRSAIGVVLAAAVFIGVGFGGGFLRRSSEARRRAIGPHDGRDERPEE